MKDKTCILALSALCSALFVVNAFAADSIGEPGRGAGGKNPLKNVYFGEEHMNTSSWFDAFTVGRCQTNLG